MYLVMTVQHNRVTSVKAFDQWFDATKYADTVAIGINRGLSKEMLAWENDEYRNVFTAPNGVSIMIEPCDEPEQMDERFQCHKYGVNLR